MNNGNGSNTPFSEMSNISETVQKLVDEMRTRQAVSPNSLLLICESLKRLAFYIRILEKNTVVLKCSNVRYTVAIKGLVDVLSRVPLTRHQQRLVNELAQCAKIAEEDACAMISRKEV